MREKSAPTKNALDCPTLGVGLALRQPLLEGTLQATDLIDWVEVTADNHMRRGGQSRRMLERALPVYPMTSHSFNINLGGTDPFNETYLSQLQELFDEMNPPWFADHLCFGCTDGVYAKDLIPLPMTREAASHVADRIRFLQDRFQRHFLFENVSYYFEYPQNEMPEHAFLASIAEQADCGLLLDVNNVYVNARNFGWDAIGFLKELPMERVVEVHVSGHLEYPEGLVDVHGSPVCEDVWEMLGWVLLHGQPAGILLERDYFIPDFGEIRQELARMRTLWDAHRPVPEKRHASVNQEVLTCR